MAKDIHIQEFDEGTNIKLQIFQNYLREWLPVFIARKKVIWNTINIFDFFAGPGSDIKGTSGTPLIIKNELVPYFNDIISKKLDVNLIFNEFNKKKFKVLEERMLPDDRDLHPYSITIETMDFKVAFDKYYTQMQNSNAANLLLFDQSGIKHITDDIFNRIIALKTTDFLFFISSATIKRFGTSPSISKYINIPRDELEKTPYHHIHRMVMEYYRLMVPQNRDYYLAPFSIKKASNIYGLIFGSGNLIGIEKFLKTCWRSDKERGEANFDIDQDKIIPGQLDIFTGNTRKPKKLELFEIELEEKILSRTIRTNDEVYIFTIMNGFIPKHANKVIKKLKTENKIKNRTFEISYRVTKNNAYISILNLAQ